MSEPSAFERALALAKADDPAAPAALTDFRDPELRGELLLAAYQEGGPGARAAVLDALESPGERGTWQAFKRIYKLAEAARDGEVFNRLTHRLEDVPGRPWQYLKTIEYLRRRSYRYYKALAQEDPSAFLDQVEDLIARHDKEPNPQVLRRLLRIDELDQARLAQSGGQADQGGQARFVAELENPFLEREEGEGGWALVLDDAGPSKLHAIKVIRELASCSLREAKERSETPGATVQRYPSQAEAQAAQRKLTAAGAQASLNLAGGGLELLDLDDEALTRALPEPPGETAGEEGSQPAPELPAPVRPWRGPIFCELWCREPARLVALLEQTRHSLAVTALACLLQERLSERLLEVELAAFYRLLEHPNRAVWRLALGQLAARARQELLQFERLVPLLERLQEGDDGPDWGVLADLLYVLDDERADVARLGVGPALRQLLAAHADAPGIGPVVGFLRRHLEAELQAPLFDWASVLPLLEARRPDVRELGREIAARLADQLALDAEGLERVLRSSLPADDPEAVQRLLTEPGAVAGGYLPGRPPAWTLPQLAKGLPELPPAGLAALRRALLVFEERAVLDPELAQLLVQSDERGGRGLGLELWGSALRRGALGLGQLGQLLVSRHEDVIVWAREALERAAGEGQLDNEVLYDLLDAIPQDVRGFARELVRQHLERFEKAELIVFCAESPDATTAELGIALYEAEVQRQREDFDLRRLLPMFRILLFKVARARAEKERLLQTLERWASASRDNAQLVVDVVGVFRRSSARLDFERALRLLVRLKCVHEDLELPFTSRIAFGAGVGGSP